MGKTIAEKILAAKSGQSSVVPGEIVEAFPGSGDEPHRHLAIRLRHGKGVGATKLYNPDRLAVVLDHIAPAKSEKNAADHLVLPPVRA